MGSVLYSFADPLYTRVCIEMEMENAMKQAAFDPLYTRVCIEILSEHSIFLNIRTRFTRGSVLKSETRPPRLTHTSGPLHMRVCIEMI